MTQSYPPVLSIEQASEYLQINTDEVTRLLEDKSLPGLKLDGKWRVLREVLDQYLSNIVIPGDLSKGVVKIVNKLEELALIALITGERGNKYSLTDISGNVYTVSKFSASMEKKAIKYGDIVSFDRNENGDVIPSSLDKIFDAKDSYKYLKKRLDGSEIYQKSQILYAAIILKYPKISNYLNAIDIEIANKNLALADQICDLVISKKGNSVYIDEVYIRKSRISISFNKYEDAINILRSRINETNPNLEIYVEMISALTQHGSVKSLREAEEYADFVKSKGIILDVTKLKERIKFTFDNPSTKRVAEILEKMGFRFDIMRSEDSYIDILIEPLNNSEHEIYNINNKSMARVYFHSSIYEYELNKLLNDLQTHIYKESNFNVAFVFARNILRSEFIFRKIRSGNYEVLIPIDTDEWRNKVAADLKDSLSILLKTWLNERDFFQDHAPVSGRFYFGRDKLENTVSSLINHGKHVGVLGLRKSGKTSFLKQIQEKRYRDIVVYIDLQSVIKDRPMDYIYWSIANQIRLEIESNRIISAKNIRERLKLGKYTDFLSVPTNSGTILMLDHDIRNVFELLDNRGQEETKIIILMDELEIMLPVGHGYNGFQDYDSFFAYIRGVSQASGGRLVTVMAAANALISELHTLNQKDNPVFQFYENIFLPPLNREESREMISALSEMMGRKFSDDALEMIYDECGGHPFITRQLCSYLIDNNSDIINSKAVKKSLRGFIELRHDVFDEILSRLERYFPLEKTILIEIIRGRNSEKSLLKALNKKNLSKELKNLEGYYIIEKNNGNYGVKISLLKNWMKQVGEV